MSTISLTGISSASSGSGGTVEVADFASLPPAGEAGIIYVTLDNNLLYRWDGAAYVEISSANTSNTNLINTNIPGVLTVQTGTVKWFARESTIIKKISGFVQVPSDGADIVLELKVNGASLDPVVTYTIPAGQNYAAVLPIAIALNTGDYITTDIIQIGSVTAGSELAVSLEY